MASPEGIVTLSPADNLFTPIRQVVGTAARLTSLPFKAGEDAHAKLGLAERVFAASTRGDVVNIQRGQRPAPRKRSSAVVLYRQK